MVYAPQAIICKKQSIFNMFENPPDQNEAQLEADLIERIYNVAISPHSYDDFMEKWSSYVGQALDQLTVLQHQVDSGNTAPVDTLSRHFEMGFRLLEELGRIDPADKTSALNSGAASMLLDETGLIVWYNGAASRYFGLRRLSRIDELPLWDRSRGALEEMLVQLKRPDEVDGSKIVLRIYSKPADKTLFFQAEIILDGDGETLLLVSQIVSNWRDSVGRMLSETFGLSPAEVQISEGLVLGADISEIAQQRSSSINTVRTQVKALLSKIGVGSQTDLVRLLISLNDVADTAITKQQHVQRGQTFRFRQHDGRMVSYHRFGAENGRPFVLLHGMLDGCDLTDNVNALLKKHGITIYAPERPSFGSAAGSEGKPKTAPERMAQDIENLLDHLKIEHAGLIGHMAGSVYAFAAAGHLGPRATAVVSIAGGVPLVSNDQIASMSPRQRLVAYTARYTPKLLPFVLRAGIRQLDFGGEQNFMRALYEGSPADLETIVDGETAGVIASGYHFSIAQGHRAFEIDSYQVVRDWSAFVEASDVPIVLIHGARDPVVSLSSVEEFAERLGPRAQLILDKNAGQLVLYKNPEMVVEALVELD